MSLVSLQPCFSAMTSFRAVPEFASRWQYNYILISVPWKARIWERGDPFALPEAVDFQFSWQFSLTVSQNQIKKIVFSKIFVGCSSPLIYQIKTCTYLKIKQKKKANVKIFEFFRECSVQDGKVLKCLTSQEQVISPFGEGSFSGIL